MTRVALCLAVLLSGCECAETRSSTPRAEPAFEAVELAGHVAWRAGPPFLARRPSSELRAAEYAVSDQPDTELAVFHFGEGEGGSVDENVGRWLDQLAQPDGRPTREVAEIEERELDGMPATIVDARGSFSGVRGSGAEEEREGYRLLGAIIEAEGGMVFFKLLGPEAGVAAAEPAFEALLTSIRAAH